jgi:predicted nucleic acid-binding protein
MSIRIKRLKKSIRNVHYAKIVDINRSIKDTAIDIRRVDKVKLPDAIIAATANYLNIPLLTADKGFNAIDRIVLAIVDL